MLTRAVNLLEQTWTDPYGGACTLIKGEYGGGTLLLACTLEHSQQVLEQFAALPPFKGNLFVCVWEAAWRVPLEQAVKTLEPHAVFLVSSEVPQSGIVQAGNGLTFLEDGRGWQNLDFPALECVPETLVQTFSEELERRGWYAFAGFSRRGVSR
jgi:hypothetical protein